MAEHGGTVEYGTATGNIYSEHLGTYRGFVTFVKYGLLSVVILLILMAFFLL